MVARSVQQSLDIEHVSQAAIQAISSSFNPLYVYVHIADPEHQALRLLRIHPVLRQDQARRAVQYVPYKSSYPIAKAYQRHTPIMIEDLQTAATTGTIEPDNQLVTTGARGYVCVPLWFGDHFEGTLTALFQEPIASEGPEVQALIGCSTHIATSLAHARLHAAVENERARLHAVIDQLPEGIVITEASDGLISYANAAAADILGIPLTHLIGAPLHRYPQSHLLTDLEGLQQTDTLIGWFDEGRMIQVLSNLMSNAIKYSPTGGEIEIGLRHTSTEHDEALIWVKDVGIGIPADAIPHIFERFHRASNLNRSVSGLGIGLYLAKELVIRHGGRIWVESTEGRGSTFYIRLPLHQHTA